MPGTSRWASAFPTASLHPFPNSAGSPHPPYFCRGWSVATSLSHSPCDAASTPEGLPGAKQICVLTGEFKLSGFGPVYRLWSFLQNARDTMTCWFKLVAPNSKCSLMGVKSYAEVRRGGHSTAQVNLLFFSTCYVLCGGTEPHGRLQHSKCHWVSLLCLT